MSSAPSMISPDTNGVSTNSSDGVVPRSQAGSEARVAGMSYDGREAASSRWSTGNVVSPMSEEPEPRR